MPTFRELVDLENSTATGVIRLVQNGDFYRAINHSAWLFHCCIAKHKVIRKYIKAIDSYVYMVGFPKDSLNKVIGDRTINKTEYGIDIELKNGEIPDEMGYEVWLKTIETEPASTTDYNSLPKAGVEAEREVINRLKACRLEKMTMVDSMIFLVHLRDLLYQR